MSTSVILSFGNGNIKGGFPSIVAQILEVGHSRPQKAKAIGSLPPCSELVELLEEWIKYYSLYNQSKFSRIHVDQGEQSLHFSRDDFNRLGRDIAKVLNGWLSTDDFRPIDQQLRTNLSIKDHFQIVIESNDRQIWQLPWHLWDFCQDYLYTEVGIATLKNAQVSPTVITRKLSRVLAILGDSHGINIEQDRQTLENLLGTAIKFLVEPSRQEFNRALWDQLGWDILFFAGHSYSSADSSSGCIFLNPHERLELTDLSHGLKQAIGNGLSLAIFNSCQGLGLASQLASLSIPYLVVMKESVPDRVAQDFLKYFLEGFTQGVPFALSMRSARQKLQGIEQEFAFASWLPVLYQNTCELPPNWSKLMKNDYVDETIVESEVEIKLFNESSFVSSIPLTKEKIIIGRSEDCDIHLAQNSISRNHAVIEKIRDNYQITDLGSHSGTLLNGVPMKPNTPYILKPQDTIEISRYRLVFNTPVPVMKNDPIDVTIVDPTIVESEVEIKLFNESSFVSTISITKERIIIGREEDCDIHLTQNSISRNHAVIEKIGNNYQITDLGSQKGTLLNGAPIKPNTPYILKVQDTIEIGRYTLEFNIPTQVSNETIEYQFSSLDREDNINISFGNKFNLTIGRDASNDVVIDHPAVSAFHGIISRTDGSTYIADLKSRNGIFVNGKRVRERKMLNYNDRIRIASYYLIFNQDETFTSIDETGNIRIDAINVCQVINDATTRQKRSLLNNISISIAAREFIIVAGVSGGGKSTLMDVLNGFRPASNGTVYVNGVDLYRNYDAYRNEIGYVPQQDIVHTELTVYQALNFAARLRMPLDVTNQERDQRILEVLSELRLVERKDTQILRLSGGQKKRVSIALELLTKPSLFFLDEATSGLDPATDQEVMQILRHIADSGKTVLLITHATENVKIADLVLFLAKGGNLAYYGTPKEIQGYFSKISGQSINTFTDIYRLVEDGSIRSAEEWRSEFLQSPYYQKYVTQRQKKISTAGSKGSKLSLTQVSSQLPNAIFSQFLILLERNFLLLYSDRISAVLVIAVTPILGILDLLTWDKNVFDTTLGSSGLAITMLFNMGLVAIIAGCLSTMREIIKESDIYKRERATGLQVSPYILSKLCFCIVLALYQSATLFIFKYISVNLTGILWQYYLILFLASLSGTVLGLFVSAISPNQNVAPLFAIVLIIPQITFGGGVLPMNSFGLSGKVLNSISLSKRPFESLVAISELGKSVATDTCWELEKNNRDNLTEKEKKEECNCLGENVFKKCDFPGILSDYDQETKDNVEGTEPSQPKRPKSPGSVPSDPAAFESYQKKVDKFNRDLKSWEKAMDKWRVQFSNWKQKRESAIGGAEGIISQIKDDYGQAFDVDIWKHMQIMICQICLIVLIVFYLQKRKDIL